MSTVSTPAPGERPGRDVIFAMVFDCDGRVRPGIKPRLVPITCDRRKHRIGWSLRTPFGWWLAWRPASGADRWEYDWADRVGAYEEATCHCRRARNIGPIAARMR